MGPAFAAVGAGVAALFEVTVASRFHFADAQLQIVLVLAIVLTVMFSFEIGMAWAFVGGVFADLLVLRPLGSSVFALLIAVGGTAALAHFTPLGKIATSAVAVAAMTVVYVVLVDVITGALRPPAYPLPLTSILWVSLVNTVFGVVVAVLVIATKRRLERRRQIVW
jgi:rod shape-determining protein MreD